MKWISGHKILTTFIGVVVLLCVIMVVSYVNNGAASPFGRGVHKVVAMVENPVSDAANGIKDGFRGIFRFRSVVTENEQLKAQVAELKKEVAKQSLNQNELQELRELSNVLKYQAVAEASDIVSANVIGMDGSKWFNIFTIDRGTESGVYKDAVVVNGDGLIGRVAETGNGWSKIVSMIDESSKVSFQVFRDLTLMGILQGDGNGKLSGFMFEGGAGVIEGDTLITSGIGTYSEGIEIGKVISVVYNNDTQLKTIVVEPSVSFKGVKKVSVII